MDTGAPQPYTVDLERSEREKVAHDEGLDRVVYNKVLRNASAFYAQKRLQIIGDALRAFDGGRFLELGSSSWIPWVEENGVKPASLVCINISITELNKGVHYSEHSRVKPEFHLMDANMLEFPDDSFDVVYGGGILHHLEFERALSEVRRVLKPGGLMLFEEPLNINPVGKFVRWLTPKARTEDERPLQNAELNLCARGFAMKSRYVQFMSVPAGVLTGLLRLPPQNVVTRAAYAVDEGLLKVVPGIGRMYRHVVLMGNKPTAAH